MSDPVDQEAEQPSFLAMSDADILNAPFPGTPSVKTTPAVDEVKTEDEETQDQEDKEDDPEAKDADDEAAGTADEADADEADEKKEETPDSKDDVKTEDTAPVDEKVEDKDKKPDESMVDYKAEYDRLMAPFKANGHDIQIKSVDDAITLMQMGANYNKKMAALKPNLKLMKLLENNGLLDEQKLSYLIDLDKKNPDAINKLVKDSGLDPMDLDTDKASEYKQTTYTVDEREIALDTVLDELQGTPSYNRTLDIVSNKWDVASKQVIAETPQILKVINDHVQSGIYDIIIKERDSERLFGRLNGLSDIEAYRQVGDALHAKGAFNHLIQGSSPTQGQPAQPVVVTPKPKAVEDDKLKDKRRAASSTKPVAPNSKSSDFNPLAMSDEEFSKVANSQFH